MDFIAMASRQSDDEFEDDHSEAEYPIFSSVQDMLSEQDLWVYDVVSDIQKMETLLKIFGHEGLRFTKQNNAARLSMSKRDKIVQHMKDQDFLDDYEEDVQNVDTACRELTALVWKIIKKLNDLVDGKVSGQSADPDTLLTQWDRQMLELCPRSRSEEAACSAKPAGKGRKRKRAALPNELTADELEFLNQGVPQAAPCTSSSSDPLRSPTSPQSTDPLPSPDHSQSTNRPMSKATDRPRSSRDMDWEIPKTVKKDMAKRREQRDLHELSNYTGSLKKAARYLERETFLQYPKINQMMEELERGFEDDVYEKYAASLIKTIEIFVPDQDEQEDEIIRTLAKIKSFEADAVGF